ncbi:hypothetical protein JTB14_034898 [Gonioctena quinquepunctata]|nr:hypothetical protein JTB14_034898 [Gonioctena quinquepunctata]
MFFQRKCRESMIGNAKYVFCGDPEIGCKEGFENCKFEPQYTTRQVLSNDMEKYLVKCSNMYHGLTPKSTRKSAYEYAVKNKLPHPQTWAEQGMAGRDWYSGFTVRHPRLSLRIPEATSLVRISSFNKK